MGKPLTQSVRTLGVKTAALAILIGMIAPVLHAFSHPNHFLPAAWTSAADILDGSRSDVSQTGQQHGPSAPQPSDHDCIVCQILGHLGATAPVPDSASIPVLVEAHLYATAPPDFASSPTPHLRPHGRAPPQIS